MFYFITKTKIFLRDLPELMMLILATVGELFKLETVEGNFFRLIQATFYSL